MKMNNLDLKKYFPLNEFGKIEACSPIVMGLSGAHVYSVSTERGKFILRLDPSMKNDWPSFISFQYLISNNEIAPKVYSAYANEKAVVTKQIEGPPFPMILRDSSIASLAFTNLIKKLKTLQAISWEEANLIDPLKVIRDLWQSESTKEHFPEWCLGFKERIDRFEVLFKQDSRRVLAHNDLNPGNILWDGKEVWFVDWEHAGINHPYYDPATLITFLNLPEGVTKNLFEKFTGSTDENEKNIFTQFREFVAIMYGLRFFSLSPHLDSSLNFHRENIADLTECFQLMGQGKLDLQTSLGQQKIGLALFKKAFDLVIL